ncbi:hypothetical protein HDZ31DRAFT_84623 [Schizophyllum fasciatum]
MAPPRASSKAARMLGIPDFPPLSPQDETSPHHHHQPARQSVTSSDDDVQDYLSYSGSAETAGDANSFPPAAAYAAPVDRDASRRRSHGDQTDDPKSAASWPVFETQPRARTRPAPPPSSSALPLSPRRPQRPSPETVAALLSSRPAGSASVENLALSSADSNPLASLSAFPLPPTTIPALPPVPAIPAHVARPASPSAAAPLPRAQPRPRRAARRPSTADATVPGFASLPNRPSMAGSSRDSSSSTPYDQRPSSRWTDSRPSTPSEEHRRASPTFPPLPPPSAPLPSAPSSYHTPSHARSTLAPSGKAALLLGVGEPGRPATPEAHKKNRLLRKFIRPHTAEPGHHAHGDDAHFRGDSAKLAAHREAEKAKHEADVMHAIQAFVYADPHPERHRMRKAKPPPAAAPVKGRSGWW